ncbi:hypothetical protein SAMN05216223_101251 [Actinacidiphila yanglinensis]|uniref:Uncharacterized protein n=1 Tax=Actinacidiphila yanglinensis TaxID=310779 RepID=A0A1H5SS66_9ACTN|nr:hypothetical protein [Actinacidiphila yanglinensis]SEF53260.1 hypothetical protein SAMN05216223_101251 [Actinacidiphila yanglinensis]
MDVRVFVERLEREFLALARAGGEDPGAPAARPEPAIRATLVDVLAAAAEEIGRGIAPDTVALRIDGDEARFVLTPAPSAAAVDAGAPHAGDATLVAVRVSRQLKAAMDHAAGREGRAVDAWLAGLAAAAVRHDPALCPADRRGKRGRQRYTAWVR